MFCQAITQTDRDTAEGHGGFDVVLEKVVQWEQETPASNGRERIDDFRLRGSRTWRRRGVHLTTRGWRTEVAHQVAHAFDHRNASLSEGAALAVVVQAVLGNPHWTRVGTDSPHRLRQPWRGGGWRVPASPGAPRREGEEVVRAIPWFLALVRHRAGGGGAHENSPHLPSPEGVALTTVIPAGRQASVLSRSWWMRVSPCSGVPLIVALCVVVCLYVAPCTASHPRLSRNPATAPAPWHRAAPQPRLLAARRRATSPSTNSKPQMAKGREGQRWRMLTTR